MQAFILLQASDGGAFSIANILTMVALIAVFYFFMIRPQQKKSKDLKNFQSSLKPGDKVVTVGGIHGKILNVDDLTVTLDIDRGSKIVVEKTGISQETSKRVQEGTTADSKKK